MIRTQTRAALPRAPATLPAVTLPAVTLPAVTLPAVTIRAAGPADTAALRGFFHRLSEQTRLLRFFAPIKPTTAMLGRLAGGGGVDAVIALADGAVIGHAMAADQHSSGGEHVSGGGHVRRGGRCSDIGVVVADSWQGRGVGSALMTALVARAEHRGVTHLTMDVLHGNSQVLAMIAAHWPTARSSRSRECLTVSAPVAWRERYPGGFAATAGGTPSPACAVPW
jgi:GNAT superfamily N-acetyltransferase